MKGHVLEKVLVVLLYDKSIIAVAALETGTAIAPLTHKQIVASKRFTNPILAS